MRTNGRDLLEKGHTAWTEEPSCFWEFFFAESDLLNFRKRILIHWYNQQYTL